MEGTETESSINNLVSEYQQNQEAVAKEEGEGTDEEDGKGTYCTLVIKWIWVFIFRIFESYIIKLKLFEIEISI